jgi:hypothetical protein
LSNIPDSKGDFMSPLFFGRKTFATLPKAMNVAFFVERGYPVG